MRNSLQGWGSSIRGIRPSTRALLLAAISLITPAGLVVVNAAAYVMAHLAAFRLAITISAVVSTALLNGITGRALYRLGVKRWPDLWLFQPEYRRSNVLVFCFLLVVVAGLAGELTYRGLEDPRRLPNLQTFLAGLLGLVVPLALAALYGRDTGPRGRRRYRTR